MEGHEIAIGRMRLAQISARVEGVEGLSEGVPHMRAHARMCAHTIMTLYSLSNPSNIPENCHSLVLPSVKYRKDMSFHISGECHAAFA